MKRKNFMRIAMSLMVLLGVLAAFLYGFLCNQRELHAYSIVRKAYNRYATYPAVQRMYSFLVKNITSGDRQKGRWRPVRNLPEAEGLTEIQREELAKLLALGYLSGYEEATGKKNVTIYVSELSYDGLNLLTSGHAEEAYLMDMSGNILHTWSYEFRDAFPGLPHPEGFNSGDFWRRAHLYENGDLLAIYDGWGLIKLDKDSNLIWAFPRRAHHDLFVDVDGLIYVLTREWKVLPRINEHELIYEDFITTVSPDGRTVRNVSLLEAFERSSYSSFLDKMPKAGDFFHTNTIEVLDGSLEDRSAIFRRGNILVSVRRANVIAIVDMEEEKVVWSLSGQWTAQHQPTLLDNGNILLFDNLGHRGQYGRSKVIEIDPFSQKIVWAYEGTKEYGFESETCGSNQRLPNGNTLITESDTGRAFEITPEKQIVWEYYNPARAGDKGELVATLFEVVRLKPDFPRDWLNASEPGDDAE